MKKILLFGLVLLVAPSVLADYGHMMGYGMMGSGWMGVYWLIWFPIAAFIFSVILWATYNWIVKSKKHGK